jgi:gliding motility-associated-like protein
LKKLQAIVLFILFSVPLKAQPPYMACFTVNTNRACAPANIVTNSSCFAGSTADIIYNYDYVANPFATGVTTTTHTYTIPGTYVIKQEVNDGTGGGGTNSTFDTIEVLDGNAQPVYTASLCAGRQAKVTVGTNYDQYEINFGDGPGSITTVALAGTYTYTYPNTAPRTITVTGRFISLCTGPTATKSILPFDNLVTPDIIDLTVNTQATTTGNVTLRYNATGERYYRTTYGTPAQYDTAFAATSGILTRTINNLNTQSTVYTFRMQNIDMCGNASAYSASISNIIISPSALNGANQVSFTSNNTLGQTYDLYRNSTLLQAVATSPYTDNNVLCGTDYCYRIQGNLPTTSVAAGTFHKSYSVTSCIKATYAGAAPVITNLNSTVEDNHVKVVWDQPSLNAAVPSVDYYTVYRSNNGSYNNYGSSNSNNYTDNGVNVNAEPYCYEISYKDACNNVSPISTNTCTVFLTVTRTDETNYLSWTSYTGYQSGIKEYIIENLDEGGNVVISKSAGLSTSFSETADPTLSQIIYRIRVVPMGTENLVSLSNIVRIDLTPQVYMPTIFTPNGDGDNDLLEVKGKYYKSVKMTIMNKWGEVLFISEDAGKGWDGNYKGQPVSIDSYAYHIVAFDNQGKEISLKGVVSLLR